MSRFSRDCLAAALLAMFALGVVSGSIVHPAKPLTSTIFVLDQPNEPQMPKHFRMSSDALPPGINSTGMQGLHMAGSGAPSHLQAATAKSHIPGPFIVIDLRQESHGYVSGNAVSWYGPFDDANRGKSDAQVRAIEGQLLEGLRRQRTITPNRIVGKNNAGQVTAFAPVPPITVTSVMNEAQMWRLNFHLDSYRVYLSDRRPPNVQQIDRFVRFSKRIPAGMWVWFHCRAGDGRTTTLMSIWDTMHNAKRVALSDILARQHAIGGTDLASAGSPNRPKYVWDQQRLKILQAFYAYARANTDGFNTSFSAWLGHSAAYRGLIANP